MSEPQVMPPTKRQQCLTLLKSLLIAGPSLTYHAWKAARDARKNGATIWLADVRKGRKL